MIGEKYSKNYCLDTPITKQDLIHYVSGYKPHSSQKSTPVTELIQFINKKYHTRQKMHEWEHVLDFLMYGMYETNKKNIPQFEFANGNKNILFSHFVRKAFQWRVKFLTNFKQHKETEGKDIKTILEWTNGYKFVEILTANALAKELNIMKNNLNCKYNPSKKIYSLRDHLNISHCTIDENIIKGKQEGHIFPLHIPYVLSFLQHDKIKIKDSEMMKLGYHKINKYINIKNNIYTKN